MTDSFSVFLQPLTFYLFPEPGFFMLNLFKHWTYQLFSPSGAVRKKYESFKELLDNDRRSHELMADLEEIYYNRTKVDIVRVARLYEELSSSVSTMVACLFRMAPRSYDNLWDYYKKIDFYVSFALAPPKTCVDPPYTRSLNEVFSDDSLVGGKAYNLLLLKNKLNLPVPAGFIISASSFNELILYNNLRPLIDDRLASLDITDTRRLEQVSADLVDMVLYARIPPEVEDSILRACEGLTQGQGKSFKFALRSSAVCEDSEITFAGQYLTVLHVDTDNILDSYKRVLASKYSANALYYRIHHGISDFDTPMAVLALEMVNARVSGAITSSDKSVDGGGNLIIHSLWGLGEALVSGEISPDTITVSKAGELKIVDRKSVLQKQQLVASSTGQGRFVRLENDLQQSMSLSDSDALTLAAWAVRIEEYYKKPQEIEWCLDENGQLILLQSRELKVMENVDDVADGLEVTGHSLLFRGGERASAGAAVGLVCKITNEKDLATVPPGSVLVVENTPPSYVVIMDRLAAVVVERGSAADHFASVAREFGVPMLVKSSGVTSLLAHGREVTVDADSLSVYEGTVESLLFCLLEEKPEVNNSPLHLILKYVIEFISPLRLIDPASPIFNPEGCRSFHDIIRFVHEKGVQEMFSIAEGKVARKTGARKFVSKIPLDLYLLDVGGGLTPQSAELETVQLDDVACPPFVAFWQGLGHPGVKWDAHAHFDWKALDDVVMAGGIAGKGAAAFASFAVISADYLNVNMRFGYHFTILDSICGPVEEENYILLRFAGGGGDFHGRSLRIEFISQVLIELGFSVSLKGDLLDARMVRYDQEAMFEKLDLVGRLFGATKLMDMILKDEEMVQEAVMDFMNGRYYFSSE